MKVLVDSDPLSAVTLDEAKAYLQVDYDSDDALIEMLIKTSYRAAERYTNSTFLEKKLSYTNHYTECLELPYGPVKSIEKVTYHVDGEDEDITDYQTLGTEVYLPKRLSYRIPQAFTIEYTTGQEVPEAVKTAILKQVYSLYESRGDEIFGTEGIKVNVVSLTHTSKTLLKPYRRMFL